MPQNGFTVFFLLKFMLYVRQQVYFFIKFLRVFQVFCRFLSQTLKTSIDDDGKQIEID